jgi:iron complex transport system substrate-binding protein
MKEFLFVLLLGASFAANAAITVVDDAGRRVTLARPAQRVISMSPHVTELLFAAGGGSRIVGAMNYSDYPAEARSIPMIGSDNQIDLERVVALKPDLLIVWASGNTARQIEQLASLGIPVFRSEPNKLDQVADNLLRFGQLLGTEPVAQQAADSFRGKIAGLARRYGTRPVVPMFYQVWDRPLYTLNGQHIVSDAIRLCGGRNIFAGLPVIAPEVSIEAVLQQDPEVIIAGDENAPGERGVGIWKPYKSMTAVKRGNLYTQNGELLTRPGPRVAQGAAELCERLEQARQRRR